MRIKKEKKTTKKVSDNSSISNATSFPVVSIPDYKKKDSHHWADFIELLCLLNKDNSVSQTDFLDRTSPQRDIEDSEDFGGGRKNYELNETKSRDAEDYFRVIDYRVSAFKNHYPFELSIDKRIISLKSNLTNSNKLYLSLLFSSLLGPFKNYKSKLTSSFELISQHALKKILPANANSILFGSSNIESENDDANSLFWNKLIKLAGHIKENVKIKKEDLSKYNKGDGGLDIYAWIDLGDNNKHFPIFFCQCACTPEWVKKQNSSKYDRWDNFISLSTYPLNIIFIPYSFRNASGDWHEFHQIEKSIIIDRERLIYCFDENEDKFMEFESSKVIEEVLKLKESIV
jgi:hypothetical protein